MLDRLTSGCLAEVAFAEHANTALILELIHGSHPTVHANVSNFFIQSDPRLSCRITSDGKQKTRPLPLQETSPGKE